MATTGEQKRHVVVVGGGAAGMVRFLMSRQRPPSSLTNCRTVMRGNSGRPSGKVQSHSSGTQERGRRSSNIHSTGSTKVRRVMDEQWCPGRLAGQSVPITFKKMPRLTGSKDFQAHIQFLSPIWLSARGSQLASLIRTRREWLLDQLLPKQIGRAFFF